MSNLYFKNVKFMKDNPLHIVFQITVGLFSIKSFKIIRIIMILFTLLNLCVDTCFFLIIFDFAAIKQYLAFYLLHWATTIIGLVVIWHESTLMKIEKASWLLLWSTNSTTTEVENKIKKEAKLTTIIAIVNTIIITVTGFITIPFGEEKHYHFTLVLYKKYCPHLYHLLTVLYCVCLPVIIYAMAFLANAECYFVTQLKFQIYMALDVIKYLSGDYEDEDDDTLIDSAEYQRVINERLCFLIKRHQDLIYINTQVCNTIEKMIAPMALAGIFVGLGVMCYIYMVDCVTPMCYFQNSLRCIAGIVTGIMYIQTGQEFQNVTENIFVSLYSETRWISFNQTNKRTLIIFMINLQKDLSFKLTEKLSVNYDLGVSITKTLYSFAAIMAKLANRY